MKLLTAFFVFCAVMTSSFLEAGTFRFLTQELPNGTTTKEYNSSILTANAEGAVTYIIKPGVGDGLPNGIILNESSGLLTGVPTKVGNFDFTIIANDGTAPIEQDFLIKTSSSGGKGAAFTNTVLADGRVGEEGYTQTLTVNGDGIGPYIFTSNSLPLGLALNGSTGEISGTPKESGTFYVIFSLVDTGDSDNFVNKKLPITVLPALSEFKFTTTQLDNGEANAAYSHTIAVSGNTEDVEFSASGLPAGVTIDELTGIISGTPTVAGTFMVMLTAVEGDISISSNLPMWITPSATSNLFFNYYGIPSAIINIAYGNTNFPIKIDSQNGIDVTYSQIGLPSGITYNSSSGILSGTPTDTGVYSVVFTATDNGVTPVEVINLNIDFAVLPPTGGDIKNLAVNLWVKSQKLSLKDPDKSSWSAQYIYNANRTAGYLFNPENDAFQVTLGTSEISIPAGIGEGHFEEKSAGKYTYKSLKGIIPTVNVRIDSAKQTIKIALKKTTINDTLPSTLKNTLILGGKSFKLEEYYPEKGKFIVTSGYRSTAFIVSKGDIKIKGDNSDTLSLSIYFCDPSFEYSDGDLVQLRIFDGNDEILNKTLTEFVLGVAKTDKNGVITYALKKSKTKDEATITTMQTFGYKSKTGKMKIKFKNCSLSTITKKEEHLTVELTINDISYSTGVTFFEPKAGSKKFTTTKMPK